MAELTAGVIDENGSPSIREVIGLLFSRGGEAAFAVKRIRMHAIDLSSGEVGGLRSCRVLLGRLDVGMVADAGQALKLPARRGNMQVLRSFLASGRAEVRSAAGLTWSADFSVYEGPGGAAALLGAHYFARPDPPFGATLTGVFTDLATVTRLRARFEELWEEAYDVTPIVLDALEDLLAEARPPLVRLDASADGDAVDGSRGGAQGEVRYVAGGREGGP